mgnify:CR=1 FL=1
MRKRLFGYKLGYKLGGQGSNMFAKGYKRDILKFGMSYRTSTHIFIIPISPSFTPLSVSFASRKCEHRNNVYVTTSGAAHSLLSLHCRNVERSGRAYALLKEITYFASC